jgi:ankyrin repeat protein
MTRLRRNGWTALHLAAGQNRVEVTKVLLEHGAEVNVKTDVE